MKVENCENGCSSSRGLKNQPLFERFLLFRTIFEIFFSRLFKRIKNLDFLIEFEQKSTLY